VHPSNSFQWEDGFAEPVTSKNWLTMRTYHQAQHGSHQLQPVGGRLCQTSNIDKLANDEGIPSSSACLSPTPTSEMELLEQLWQAKYTEKLDIGRTIS
jgi:hypothetical protein